MPPAQEPDEPPINISSIAKTFDAPLRPPNGIVAYPAVLQVTDIKDALSSLPPGEASPIVSGLFHS